MVTLNFGRRGKRGEASDKKSSGRAITFLVLFSLPFAGGGTFVGYLAGSMVTTWARAQSWQEVPARILSADLHVTQGDSDSYRLDALYEYTYLGETHTSDAVDLTIGSDNVGSFHQDKYAELSPYLGTDRRFRCFVNPNNPAESVLFRELRWGMLALQLIFAAVFCLVGYGLIFAAFYGGRLQKEATALKEKRPEQPWLWEKDWATGTVTAGSKGKMIGSILFAVLWNLISAPALMVVPDEVRGGNTLALIALMFPAIGALLAVYAIYATLQWLKFGNSAFELSHNPGVLGGYLEGRIHTNIRNRAKGGFELTLSCIRKETTGSGDNRSTHEKVLWQDAVIVPPTALSSGRHGSSVPVRFGIPYGAGPVSDPEASDPVEWRLEVEAELPGVDYSTHFRVPVFVTADSDPDFEPPDSGSAASGRDRVEEMRAVGIHRQQTAGGGVTYVFARARAKGAAFGLTVFTAMWCGFIWLMINLGAPILFPIVFGLFALLMVVFLLDMWLKETRVEVADGTLIFTSRMISSGKKLTFGVGDIASIRSTRGMQSGNELYHKITLRTHGGKRHTLAGKIADGRMAKRLIEDLEDALTG